MNHLKIEGNVGTAFDLSFLCLLIFSDPIEIRLGSVSVFNPYPANVENKVSS